MITGFFLQVFYAVIAFFVGLLPVSDFPTQITSAIQAAWYYINSFSYIFPVGTLLTIIGIATIFHAAVLFWRLAHLVGGYIRGK